MLRNVRVRSKLLIMLAAPVAALVGIAGVSASQRLDDAADAAKVRDRVDLATAITATIHHLQAESGLSARVVASAGTASRDALDNQRRVTDAVVARVRPQLTTLLGTDAAGGTAASDALRRLGQLTPDRASIDARVEAGATSAIDEVTAPYAELDASLLAVNASIAATTGDAQLTRSVSTYLDLSRAKELVAGERAFLLGVLTRGGFAPGEHGTYLALTAREDDALARFRDGATAEQRAQFDRRMHLSSLDEVNRLRAAAVDTRDGGSVQGDADAWFIGTSTKLGFLKEVEDQLAGDVRSQAATLAADADRSAQTYVAIAGGAVLLALLLALGVLRSITRPLRRLTRAAYGVSSEQLPRLVEGLRRPDLDGASAVTLEPIAVRGRDEIGALAEAFNSIQSVAVDVSTEQAALLRKGIGDLFVNLARRNQNLLERQLELLDDLEADERDPDALAGLFRLDHLATRMRRNAESLLVLAGAEQSRRWGAPVALADVVRAAVGEVAEMPRVSVGVLEDLVVAGHAAADVAHLLAELLENATSFSSPQSLVDVSGHWLDGNYVVLVRDHGVGLSVEQLGAANVLLASPPAAGLALSPSLGFVVVGRLAERYGIAVRLHPAPGGGLIAAVGLPAGLIGRRGAEATADDLPAAPTADATQLFRALRARWANVDTTPDPAPEPAAVAPEDPVAYLADQVERFAQAVGEEEAEVDDAPAPPPEPEPAAEPLPDWVTAAVEEDQDDPRPPRQPAAPEPSWLAVAEPEVEPEPEPEPVAVAAVSTEAGLVRRVPGAALADELRSIAYDTTGAADRPDDRAPDAVRARLSSYRDGLARARGAAETSDPEENDR